MQPGDDSLNPNVEYLEPRHLLAGDVTVDVRGGNLFVDGDNLSNRITILGEGPSVAIEGDDGTTINGLPSQDFTGVTKNVIIRMRDGNDWVTMEELAIDGNVSVNLGNDRARFTLRDSTVSGDVRITTGIVGADDMGGFNGVRQRLNDNVIDGRISIRNGHVHAVEADSALYTSIFSNTVGRGVHLRQGRAEVTNVAYDPCCVTAATTTGISNNSILSGGLRITTGNVSVSQPSLYTTGNRVGISNNTTIVGGITIRLGATETSNGDNDAQLVDGSRVIIRQNLFVDGNVSIRVGNATVSADGANFVRGNRIRLAENAQIAGNVTVRQGSVTAIASANTVTGNLFELVENSVAGQVNVTNGAATVVSDVEGFSLALGISNVIEQNELNRLRITNRSGSSNSPGISGGILTEIDDNTISHDLFVSDGSASGAQADAVLNVRDSTIGGRLNYVGRNGSNAISLHSVEVVGRLLARAGNGDDSFGITNSMFESSLRLDGGGGDSDEFHNLGGNTFEGGQPVLVSIEVTA